VFARVAIVLFVVWRLKYSAYGRAMFAQREDTVAAQSVGIVIMRPRLLAFVVSAFFTAVVGALYAHFLTSFSPKAFYFDITFRVITMMVVGGMGSVTGSVVGPIAVTVISEILRRVEDATLLYGISQIVLAVLFILIIIYRPGGLLGDREFDFGWFTRRKVPKPAVQGEVSD
jgi:branched-chain amino acid transport system permease protein